AVKFMQAFWKDACDEGGFAWDDTSNNRAFLSGEIAATLNGASIYIAAKRGADKIKDEKGESMVKDIQHGPIPNGPAGTYSYHVASSHAVMRYGKNVKLAKDFPTWLHGNEHFATWFATAEGCSVGATKSRAHHAMWRPWTSRWPEERGAPPASRWCCPTHGPPSRRGSRGSSRTSARSRLSS